MKEILAASIGGALAIIGGVVGSVFALRGERQRQRSDTQVRISAEVLAAAQVVNRAVMTVAFSDLRPREFGVEDSGRHEAMRLDFEAAMTTWYSAMGSGLVAVDRGLAEIVRKLDAEFDRITTVAHAKRWSRDDFRQERNEIGRLLAAYIDEARRLLGEEAMHLGSFWTWA